MIVVRTVTISTTNMTGFLIRTRGSSFTKDETTAGQTILGSNRAEAGVPLRMLDVSMNVTPISIRREQRAGGHREVFDDGAERKRREEGEAADDQDDADGEADEQPAGGREGAGRRRHGFLLRERTGNRHRRDDHPEAADQHRDGAGDVVEEDIA